MSATRPRAIRLPQRGMTRSPPFTSEPRDKDYGQRQFGVRDPEGHDRWFATPLASPAGWPTQ
jgi:uncharacterized glyoxalase superfamily protein PhnB